MVGDRVSKPALSLLRQYISQVYPLVANSSTNEMEPLCRSLWTSRMILKQILMTAANESQPALRRFITESSITFSHCYQAFYPTDSLKWQGLCELILQEQRSSEVSFHHVLRFSIFNHRDPRRNESPRTDDETMSCSFVPLSLRNHGFHPTFT